jgi:small subunit ribosomal protein S16
MLAIRMQRTGRKGHAMFRVIVQDARRTPTSGKVVARLGSYDPHAKTVTLDKEKASFYLDHGAQPSDRVVRLLKDEGVKLPAWVKAAPTKENAVRNPDKRRSTRLASAEPAEVAAPEAEAPAETSATPEAAADQAPEESELATPTEETVAATPAEVPADVEPSEAAEESTEQPVGTSDASEA